MCYLSILESACHTMLKHLQYYDCVQLHVFVFLVLAEVEENKPVKMQKKILKIPYTCNYLCRSLWQ